ncbi:MAG: PEP-CTERM sorting domain-containing protein [Verrucomicrobiota bacterium]
MKSLLCLFALAVPCFGAISFSLPGATESASWTLTSAVHPGFNTFGTAANPWGSAVTPDAGAASAVLNKTDGSGYIGGAFLYTAGTSGSFSISDTSSIASLATIVLQGRISDPLTTMVLNYNGGSQALPADFSVVVAGSPYPDRAWQWDLSGISGITSYEILYSGHHAATTLSVTTGDTFLQVIPEPSTAVLGVAALGLTFIRRRRA